jgi:Lipocalin-like domain
MKTTLFVLLFSVFPCFSGVLPCFSGRGATVSVSAQESAADVQKRFVGLWRLVKVDTFDEKGGSAVAAYDGGRIMYDADGNMSAQLMRSGRKPLSTPSTEAERAAAYATYTAYFGKYTVDATAEKVTHHVEGAANPNWVKTDLVRWYTFSPDGNRLMLSVKNAQGRTTTTLTWERLK